MPFNSSYRDGEKFPPLDSRDYFCAIAGRVVREPLATHIIQCKNQEGKTRFLVVVRGEECEEGSMVIAQTKGGLKVGKLTGDNFPRERIWGKVVWYLQCTR